MKLTPEQAVLAMVVGDATHDARRQIIAGYSNWDEETLFAGIKRAAKVIGVENAVRGTLTLIDQIEAGKFDQ